METGIDLFCNLHNLLFLQSLADLNELRAMTTKDGLIDIARIRQTHDNIPTHLLGKDLKRPRLFYLFCQLKRILAIRNT